MGKRHFGKISPINFLYQSKISSWHQVAKLKLDQQENGEKEIRVLGSEGIVVSETPEEEFPDSVWLVSCRP